jgi:hypothetical protein
MTASLIYTINHCTLGHTQGFLDLPLNVRLGSKWLAMKNTLAYHTVVYCPSPRLRVIYVIGGRNKNMIRV